MTEAYAETGYVAITPSGDRKPIVFVAGGKDDFCTYVSETEEHVAVGYSLDHKRMRRNIIVRNEVIDYVREFGRKNET